MPTRTVVLTIAAVLVTAGVYLLVREPSGERSLRVFEPDRVAELETDMWQAYYQHANVRLFTDLVTYLREQYHYSWAQAAVTSFYLARAAATFATATGDYERVLPDLEHAYARIRQWMHADFEPASVARAELAWWVARRVPGENDPAHVGRLIAEENALVFGTPADRVLQASILRARAGRLRDDGGEHADWATVSGLLQQSYQQLHAAVNQ